MVIALILIALVLIISGVRGETETVTNTLKSDLAYGASHSSQFGMWIVVLMVLSAVGTYKPARQAADLFIVLLLLVFFIRNRGFFDKLIAAFK